MCKFESSSHESTLYFSSHEIFVSHMDLYCIGRQTCCESFGTCMKMCCRNFVMLEKFRPLDLFLGTTPSSIKVLCLSFLSRHHTLGGILLHLNLVTIMLWYSYSLVYSNPSKFSLEKWRFKLSPCNFSLFWARNAPLPLTKSVTYVSNAPNTLEKSGSTSPILTTRSGSPLSPPAFFIREVVLEFSRKKEKFWEASRNFPLWRLIPMV